MNVLLIGNLVEDRQESMQRFTALLHTGLKDRGHDVTVLSPRLRFARFGPRYRYGGGPKYLGYFDKFVLFPRELRRLIRASRPDVVHFTDHANAVYAASTEGVPTVATCHDLLQIRAARGELPRQSVSGIGRRYQAWIGSSLARMRRVACISAATRSDLLWLTRLPAARALLIPNALNYPYQRLPSAVAQSRLDVLATRQGVDPSRWCAAPGGFVLHVGGDQWYKNREGLLHLFAELQTQLSPPPTLVLVGPPLTTAQTALAAERGVSERLVVFSNVTNLELEALYHHAEALLFPSWEEGFGWPLAEAQACGCPVFASNRAPMNEVGGNSAFYFDPQDMPGSARSIARAWSARNSRRALALTEAQRWDPALMLAAYETCYREAIG